MPSVFNAKYIKFLSPALQTFQHIVFGLCTRFSQITYKNLNMIETENCCSIEVYLLQHFFQKLKRCPIKAQLEAEAARHDE